MTQPSRLFPLDSHADFAAFQRRVHALAVSKGFWDGQIAIGEKLALIHGEVSELLETYRDDPTAPCPKDGLALTAEEEELGDIMLRLLDFAQHRGLDALKCAVLKDKFNQSRPYKHNRKF